jgi:hypothetical protein
MAEGQTEPLVDAGPRFLQESAQLLQPGIPVQKQPQGRLQGYGIGHCRPEIRMGRAPEDTPGHGQGFATIGHPQGVAGRREEPQFPGH